VITSADCRAAPPAVLAAWVQCHWGIENRAHWVRDVVYDEDRSQVRTGSAPQVMATLRNTAISLWGSKTRFGVPWDSQAAA
jgi:predicted transposase YbfD/YdcC